MGEPDRGWGDLLEAVMIGGQARGRFDDSVLRSCDARGVSYCEYTTGNIVGHQ
jgi:hypothetical protein